MLHVALGDLDEVGDEIVAALELDVDLGECVLEAVAQGDEGIVDAGDPQAEDDNEGEQDAKNDEDGCHGRMGGS